MKKPGAYNILLIKPGGRVVEVSHSWLNRFRKLFIRYEKLPASCIDLHVVCIYSQITMSMV